HWPTFFVAAVNYIHALPNTTDADLTKRNHLIAFLFGVVSHSVADVPWHSLDLPEGFINALQWISHQGSFSRAHTAADVGGEFTLAGIRNLDYFVDKWKVPASDLSIGEQWYAVWDWGLSVHRLIDGLEDDLDQFIHQWYSLCCFAPILVDQYQNYFKGGINDISSWVSTCWDSLAVWLRAPNSTSIPFCDIIANVELDEPEELEIRNRSRRIKRFSQSIKHSVSLFDVETPKRHIRIYEEGDKDGLVTITLGSNFWFDIDIFFKFLWNLKYDTLFDVTESIPVVSTKSFFTKFFNIFKVTAVIIAELFLNMYQFIFPPFRCTPIQNIMAKSNQNAILRSNVSYGNFGKSLVTGDWNNDGVVDLAISAPTFTFDNKYPHVGAVFILTNMTSLDAYPYSTKPVSEYADFVVSTGEKSERFGTAMVTVDLNHDGIDDLAVSAPSYGSSELEYSGRIYVYFGRTSSGGDGKGEWGKEPDVVISPPQRTKRKIPDTEGRGFDVLGSVLYSADVDGDGSLDLVVGSPFANGTRLNSHQRGVVHIFLSSSNHLGNLTTESADFTRKSPPQTDFAWFGASIRFLTDQENKKLLVIGSPAIYTAAGRVYGFVYNEELHEFEAMWWIDGDDSGSGFGSTLEIGDFLGNGKSLLAISAPTQTNPKSLAKFVDLPGILTPLHKRGYGAGSLTFIDPFTVPPGQNTISKLLKTFKSKDDDTLLKSTRIFGLESNARFGKNIVVTGAGFWVSQHLSWIGSGRMLYFSNSKPLTTPIQCISNTVRKSQMGVSMIKYQPLTSTTHADPKQKPKLVVSAESGCDDFDNHKQKLFSNKQQTESELEGCVLILSEY
ncbi:Glycosylphosphatidylinositol specific phospholipase D1, partial [Nowakowskiella sp. JEL0407]